MRNNDHLSAGEVVLWSALGLGAGLVAGIALSEWLGEVNRGRLRRAATRLRRSAPVRTVIPAIGVASRAARAALHAEPMLRDLALEAVAISRGVVALRGWVPTRAARARAARVVRAAPGIDTVVNSILVRGEDDRLPGRQDSADQPA